MVTDVEIALLEFRLMGYKLVKSNGIWSHTNSTWFQPMDTSSIEMYTATRQSTSSYDDNTKQSIILFREYLKLQESND
jgi:hypothetical protein